MKESFPDVMTIQETSQYLRIPVSSFYPIAQQGKFWHRKLVGIGGSTGGISKIGLQALLLL